VLPSRGESAGEDSRRSPSTKNAGSPSAEEGVSATTYCEGEGRGEARSSPDLFLRKNDFCSTGTIEVEKEKDHLSHILKRGLKLVPNGRRQGLFPRGRGL